MVNPAYFDNAATTFPKPESVYDFADEFYRTYGANAGRGQYPMVARATELIDETRNLLLTLYRCNNKQTIFTSSATEALNKILFGLEIPQSSTVYISPLEHNSVTRVVHAIKRTKQIEVKLLPFDKKTLEYDEEQASLDFEDSRPAVVVSTHASNVCGAVLPIENIFAQAKEHGAVTIADMSQTFGLIELNLASRNIDYAVFAGHKSLLAPFGVGGFICDETARLAPVFYGGTGSNSSSQDISETLQESIEIGSPNIYALAGLNASLKWILENGLPEVRNLERKHTDTLLSLLQSYRNITIVADNPSCDRIGIVSALFDNYTPDEIGKVFGNNNIAVRAGLHCSPYAHSFLDTAPNGSVRFSVSSLTVKDDFMALENVLDYIRDNG